MVGRPVFTLKIGTLFADFAKFLYLVRLPLSLNERQASLLEMRDQLLVHRIPAVLQSKRRHEKSTNYISVIFDVILGIAHKGFLHLVCFKHALASTCPHFVEVLWVRRGRLGTEPRAVYYLRSSNDTVVKDWEHILPVSTKRRRKSRMAKKVNDLCHMYPSPGL
ncbi:hypothetical protein RHSIM_Rhsim09G0055900 [Rhododendron simsii]|uniref:Uncharacterized protein n=1 Tax=Rhododendron simsii TaxID=118357 RepID=A0A834GG61_RHOSS|nr:hypothetical protein RHSIM_Rhsim09G0055900 [Rhododendron simsii]